MVTKIRKVASADKWLVFFLLLAGLVMGQTAAASEVMGMEVPWWRLTLPSRSCPGTTSTDCHLASPVVADLNGDGLLEIIVATNQGHVLAVDREGEILWDRDVAAAFGMAANSQLIASSPAVGDVDGDGLAEVVVGAGSFYSDCTQGGVIILEQDGTVKAGWPVLAEDADGDGCRDTVFASPAIGDLDHDGDLEIVAGSYDKRIYAWDDDGSLLPGFPPDSHHLQRFIDWEGLMGKLADTVWSSPVLADLDQDGYLDIITGTDEGNYDGSWPGNADGWNCPYASPPGWPQGYCGGALYALDRFGQEMPGWPKYVLESIQSTPAVADVLGDSHPELFVGTGIFYHNNSPDHPTDGFRVFGWDYLGQPLPGWEGGQVVGSGVPSSPVIGDIAGDSEPEVVVLAMDKMLYAWHLNGEAVSGFPMRPRDHNGLSLASYDVGTSIVLADYDGEPKMEMLFSQAWEVTVVDGDGQQLTATDWPDDIRPTFFTNGWLLNTPTVADLDGDGKLELITSNSELFIWSLEGSTAAAQWPMFKLNAQRTGTLPEPPRLSLPAGPVVFFVLDMGEEQTAGALMIGNGGGGSLTWEATAPAGVSLSPASGTLAAGGQQAVAVAVTPAAYGPGTYDMGEITVTARAGDGAVVAGSPATTSLILVVGPYSQVYLPVIVR